MRMGWGSATFPAQTRGREERDAWHTSSHTVWTYAIHSASSSGVIIRPLVGWVGRHTFLRSASDRSGSVPVLALEPFGWVRPSPQAASAFPADTDGKIGIVAFRACALARAERGARASACG